MAAALYQTLADIRTIIRDSIAEGVSLEYKGSAVLKDRDANTLCKTISALANSVGGQFIIGVETQNGKPTALDGGVSGVSRLDWIHTIINGHTFPAIESVEVVELPEPTGSYYIITVPASSLAPHQSKDLRYYKRRGSHSEPMEHYEIEDVRSRPKQALMPLRVELFTEGHVAYLRLKNEHATDGIKNIRCETESNFDLRNDRLRILRERGLRELRSGSELFFIIGGLIEILGKNADAELKVILSYEIWGTTYHETMMFYLGDLNQSAVMRSPTVKALEAIGEKIEKLSDNVERLRRETEVLAQIADGTGLRLSQRTVLALQRSEQRFDPNEFDWAGYRIILDLSMDEAISLHDVFGVMDSSEGRRTRYKQLPEELRQKFEKFFKVEFD